MRFWKFDECFNFLIFEMVEFPLSFWLDYFSFGIFFFSLPTNSNHEFENIVNDYSEWWEWTKSPRMKIESKYFSNKCNRGRVSRDVGIA